jgi:hypothetical protein
MDRQVLFDTLTLRLADAVPRRQVLLTLGRFVLALLVFGIVPGGLLPWRVRAGAVTPQSQLVKGCKLPGQQCSGENKCCAKKCDKDHRCGCINKGHEPLVDTPLGPTPVKALCCSNKLNKRTGECK